MKIIVFILMYMLNLKLYSATIVDIYGAQSNQSLSIIKKHTTTIIAIENAILDMIKKNDFNSDKSDLLKQKKDKLIQVIKQEGGFLFFDFGTVTYGDRDDVYTTVEVIEKNQPERLQFVNLKHNCSPRHFECSERSPDATIGPRLGDPSSQAPRDDERAVTHKGLHSSPSSPDLIDVMNDYDTKTNDLFFNHKYTYNESLCPVYHCTFGFEHPILKPYLARFNQGVIEEKQWIKDTLLHDKSPERRASAAFLVGHFNDPNEIIVTLMMSVTDSSALVRNNAMRVIGSTMQKANINQIDIDPFLNALNSPYETDRNKALSILLKASNTAEAKHKIAKKAGHQLVSLLQLKQPNNHDFAYKILKKLSGKLYQSDDIAAWKRWALTAASQQG